jgi:hypothetical protein
VLKPARLTIGIAEPVSDGKFDVTKLIKDQRHSTPEHNRSIIRHTIRLANIQAVELPGLEFDEFLLFAIRSGLLSKWAGAFPDPRQEPEIGMEVRLATQLAAPVAGLYSMRQAGYVLRSVQCWAPWAIA